MNAKPLHFASYDIPAAFCKQWIPALGDRGADGNCRRILLKDLTVLSGLRNHAVHICALILGQKILHCLRHCTPQTMYSILIPEALLRKPQSCRSVCHNDHGDFSHFCRLACRACNRHRSITDDACHSASCNESTHIQANQFFIGKSLHLRHWLIFMLIDYFQYIHAGNICFQRLYLFSYSVLSLSFRLPVCEIRFSKTVFY